MQKWGTVRKYDFFLPKWTKVLNTTWYEGLRQEGLTKGEYTKKTQDINGLELERSVDTLPCS